MLLDPIAVAVAVTVVGALILFMTLSEYAVARRLRMRRVRSVVANRAKRGVQTRAGLGPEPAAWRGQVLGIMRQTTRRVSVLKDRQIKDSHRLLVSAGYRGRDAIVVYSFFKLVSPFAFLGGTALWVYGLDPIGKGPMLDLAAVVAGALLGSKLPDLYLTNTRDKRLEVVRKSLPDALDMLVICAEAGLATDAAIKRVVSEIGRRATVLGDELSLTTLELSFMPERRQALDNLAERVPLPAIVAFVNTLIQAERYGTPLARAFKVLSAEQRNERMMKAEEKAGRLPATMTVPMMMFILPALFVVLIGPAILDIMDNYVGR